MSQSLDRALVILEELENKPQRLGVLAEAIGSHKSTTLRLLQTLERRGFVRRVDELPTFALGMRILRMAASLQSSLSLVEVARPHLRALGAATGQTIHIGILDGPNIVYLDKVDSVQPVQMYSRIGLTAPAYCTAIGKVILAHTDPAARPALQLDAKTPRTITSMPAFEAELARISARGYSLDDREHEDTVRCLAVPIGDHSGKVVAGVSVSTVASQVSRKQLMDFVDLVAAAGNAISHDLGAAPNGRAKTEA